MRARSTISLTAIALVAMAVVGAAPAAAEGTTAICKVHEDPCSAANQVTELSFVGELPSILLTSIVNVLCLGAELAGKVESPLAKPLGITPTLFQVSKCGTNATHNNCTITTLKLGLVDVLKTDLNLGNVTILGGELLEVCGAFIHCVYGGTEIGPFAVEGALHQAGSGHGMFTAEEVPIPALKGFLCPQTTKLDGLFEPQVHLYITS